MDNYTKIKQLIETGFMVQGFDKKDKNYTIFTSIMSDGNIRCSMWRNNFEECYDYLGTTSDEKEDINYFNLELTPIPHRYKELKGKVDILDIEEAGVLRGKKGLEAIVFYSNNTGEHYYIWNKDTSYYEYAQAWAVVPHFEEVENATEEAIKMLKDKGYKIIKIIK